MAVCNRYASFFTDVKVNDVSYNAIKALYKQGIMIGTSETQFSPNSPVTRASAIVTLGRPLKIEQAESSSFNDVVKNFVSY